VADCTGHGVPGGFMSMLGTSFLNEIVIEKKVHEPDEILNQLRQKVITALKQQEESAESKDGMDIVFLRINLTSLQLSYAAANNGFYIIPPSGKLQEFNPDKMPIGVYGEMKPFSKNEISLEKGTAIYAFTDGFADQFGGPQGKKFKYLQFEKLFQDSFRFKSAEQKNKIDFAFSQWKADYEQVDDVCVTGIII
jgi:serine phosphatase RsbU (regulator of sigma subunit)